MKLKNLFFAAAAVLGVVACQNKPSVAEGVTVDPAEITFAKEGETKEVTITTADEWKLSVPEDLSWLEISDKKGSGTTKITLKAPDNTDGYDRSGNITVKAGMYSARIKISQPGKGEKVDSPIEKLLAMEVPYDAAAKKTTPIVGAVDLTDIWWVAKFDKTGIITDGTACIVVYSKDKSIEGAVGEKGTMKGDLDNYSYHNQVINPVFTKTGTVEVNHGTALELKDQIDTYNWEGSPIIYVHVIGTAREVTSSGKQYINIFLFDNDGKQRSRDVSFASNSVDGTPYKDKDIDFYGYYVSGTNHVSVMPVGEITVKGDAAPDYKLTVSAKQTETGFEASWNEVEGADKYNWALLKGDENGTKVDGGDVTEASVSKDVEFEYGATYTVVVKALKGSEELVSANASFTARDKSNTDATTIELSFEACPEGFPSSKTLDENTYTIGGYEFTFKGAGDGNGYYWSSTNKVIIIGKKDAYIIFPSIEGKALVNVTFTTGSSASENVILDIADKDGKLYGINTEKLKKGTEYSWDVNNSAAGEKCRIVVTNAYNAQFQNLTLIYE
ncbi:MAG: BACON domain-containing protein [Bacteroidales bacterium]|nr:BACON domain-containing protein [Bacteroidales bacterium]